MREVLGSVHGLEAGYPDWSYVVYFSLSRKIFG
jgi:hypothetical protein